MHKGFSESGRAKLRAECADDAAYEAEVGRYKARFGFFAGKYEGWYWWYEVLEMFRKLLLTSLGSALASGDKPYSQLLIKIAISFVFLCFFIRHSPFAADEVDVIVVSTQTCTLLTLMYALCIRIDFFAAEGISDNTMAVGMLIIQTAPLLIALIVIGWLFKSVYGDVVEEKRAKLRRLSRKMSRQLSLGKSMKGAAMTAPVSAIAKPDPDATPQPDGAPLPEPSVPAAATAVQVEIEDNTSTSRADFNANTKLQTHKH